MRQDLEQLRQAGITGLDVGTGLLPIVGDARNAVEVISGRNLITGEPLSTTERVIGGIAIIIPGVPKSWFRAAGRLLGNTFSRVFRRFGLQICFPPDTLIGTENGLRPIGQVEAGERVWAYDFQGAMWRLAVVERRHDSHYDGPIITLDLDVGEVRATAYHPFWVIEGQDLDSRPALRHVDVTEDRGKSLSGRWVNSHDLREGDVVFLRDRGPATIRQVMQRHERIPVCNLTVEGLNTFAVGEAQVLVHNASGSAGPTRLSRLHTSSLSPSNLDRVRRMSTDEIVNSLRTAGPERLRIRPDGTVLQGNHRVRVLEERGFDTSRLIRDAEVIPVTPIGPLD